MPTPPKPQAKQSSISFDKILCCGVFAIYAASFPKLSIPSLAVLTKVIDLVLSSPFSESESNRKTYGVQMNTRHAKTTND
jgi:hypothetical protein